MSESPAGIKITGSSLLSERIGLKRMAPATGSNSRKKGVLAISSFIFAREEPDCNFANKDEKRRLSLSGGIAKASECLQLSYGLFRIVGGENEAPGHQHVGTGIYQSSAGFQVDATIYLDQCGKISFLNHFP